MGAEEPTVIGPWKSSVAESPDPGYLALISYIAAKIAKYGPNVTFSWDEDSFKGIALGFVAKELATVTFNAVGRSHLVLTEKGRAWAVLAALQGYVPTV